MRGCGFMGHRVRTALGLAMVVVLGSCESESPPSLQVDVILAANGSTARVEIIATTGKGLVGSGTVALKSSAGTLADDTVTLDTYGTARTTLTCDVAVDPSCTGRVTVTAKWSSAGGVVEATDVVTVGATGAGGGGGSDGGSGSGGAGGGSGGTKRFTNECQGMPPPPGQDLNCCRPPLCPAVLVAPGATVSIPFRRTDGGSRVNIDVTWAAPASTSSLADCEASMPRLVTNPGYVSYTCSNFTVSPNGEWRLISTGGCSTNSGGFCNLLYRDGDGGAAAHAMTLNSVYTPGSLNYELEHDNNDTYVFMLR
jgi:hypothetical protein